MLAQNFMSAEALDITEEQHEALVKTLRLLESGKFPEDHHFDMSRWKAHISRTCETAMCIGGTAEFLSREELFNCDTDPRELNDLFYPSGSAHKAYAVKDPVKGAHALRNYLTTGEARWNEVIAERGNGRSASSKN